MGHLYAYATTPLPFNSSTCSALNPTTSRSNSLVCSPSKGGGLRMLGSALEYFTGGLITLIGPQAGCSIVCTIPRACTCSWFIVPWISFTAAYGKPLPSKISCHRCVVRLTSSPSIKGSNTARLLTRSLLLTNRGSFFHPDLPILSQRIPNRRSFAPPTKISPSAVLNP